MKIAHRTKIIGCLFTIGLFVALHFARAQATADTTGPVMTDPNEDASNLSDLAVEIQALEMATPIAASNEPSVGNFYSAQHAPGSASEWPPLPGNIDSLPVWPLDTNTYLLDDLHYNYAKNLVKSSQTANGIGAVDDLEGPPDPGDGSDTNTYTPLPLANLLPNYGTNLFIADFGMVSNELTGIASNTIAVEYAIQTNSDLTTPTWADDGQFILGSAVTNWTQFTLPPPLSTNNLFFRLQSEASGDNSGIPSWWEAEYFGTNLVNPNAQDSAGDGWTIYQKFEMGVAPNVFVTPPTPQVSVSFNTNSGIATVSWQPLPGAVTNYLVSENDVQKGITTNFNLSAITTSFLDNLSGESPYDTNAGWGGPTEFAYYSVEGEYSGGNSPSGTATLQFNLTTPTFSLISGPGADLYVIGQGLPSDLQELEFYRQSQQYDQDGTNHWPYGYGINYPVDVTDGYFRVPAAAINEGIAPIPSSQMNAFGAYQLWVRSIRTNGLSSDWISLGIANNNVFVDARQQIKDNVRAKLSGAPENSPFDVNDTSYTTNLVYSGFQNSLGGFDPLLPIEDNYEYRNFAFNSTNISTNIDMQDIVGAPNGVNDYYGYLADSGYYSVDYASFITTNSPIAPPSLLTSAQATWFYNLQFMFDSFPYGDPPANLTVATAINYYGLPYLSAEIVMMTNTADPNCFTLYPGDTIPYGYSTYFAQYSQATEPNLQPDGYYFARIGYDPVPEQSTSPSDYPQGQSFATTNMTPLMIAGVGQSMQIAGYAQFVLTNGYPGMYAYEGQYFTNAYEIDTNGVVTTNTTGVLSPYGNFFATEPGPVALVTMPDPDTGQQGTCTVYCVSLALDKNHDGTIDTNFNGPDATSPNSPFVFWANNNYDRYVLDADDNAFYDDDVEVQDSPGTPDQATPDCNYLDGAGQRVIPCARDLQDYTRLWICGITSNLLANLPAGSTVTLNWGDVGYPNPNNPTIDLFPAADPNGGIGYLTNSATAESQVDFDLYPYVGRIGPGSNLVLNASQFANNWAGNHFIWCGVSNGTGGLNLTFADAHGNVLAQTTAYIQIVDIAQMYERWTVGDQPNIAPLTNAIPASEDLPIGVPAFQYAPPTDTNTPYILYVHGWNMEQWEKDRFAESAFKRLYWQGYHGRFGSFRWPTYNGFTGSFWQTLTDPRNFDNSAFVAYQSATGLLNKLTDLNAEYPGHVYVLAHSMGNIVTGEALRLAAQNGSGQLVNTYVGSQAALSAHNYDATVTTPYLLQFNYHYPSGLLSAAGTVNYGPYAPDIYGNRLTNNAAAAGRRINFYNTNDFALAAPRWGFDQILKPDGSYLYTGPLTDPSPWNKFAILLNDGATNMFDIVNNLTDLYTVEAYAAPSYSTALGATPNVLNISENLDLTTVWPPDQTENNYIEHFWHSAEFRGDCWQEWNYWNTLLFSPSFGFNINNP